MTDLSVRDLDKAEGECVCPHNLEGIQVDFDLFCSADLVFYNCRPIGNYFRSLTLLDI